jgi:hypothetical protein
MTEMDYSNIKHGSKPPTGHEGHDHHAKIDDYKMRFFMLKSQNQRHRYLQIV